MSPRPSTPNLIVSLLTLLSLMLQGCALIPERVDTLTSVAELEEPEVGFLARAQRHIEEREYRASENSEGLQAPNRAHNLRTYFGPSGIRVHDRTQAGSPELFELTLTGVGRGETLVRIGPGEVSSEGPRVEIKRPGLVEWYVNTPAGLEQGFTLTERTGGEGLLRLELAVLGGEAALRGDDVIFKTATGRRLRYSKLVATDADGTVLVAHMEVPAPNRIQLWVDETNAVYPLTIDPILTATGRRLRHSKLVATDADGTVSAAQMKAPARNRRQPWVDEMDAVYPSTTHPVPALPPATQLESD